MQRRKGLSLVCIILITVLIISSGCSAPKDVEQDKGKGQDESREEINSESKDGQKTVLKAVFPQGRSKRAWQEVPFNPVEIAANVAPYQVDKDLTNIENLNQFGEFTQAQKKLLAANGFVVNPTLQEQLFYIYENNEYKKVPSFITTDSVLQVYHIFYDYSLRTLEKDKMLGILEELTESMLHKSVLAYNSIDNEELKTVQLKNIAYFAVAQKALEKPLPAGVPPEAEKLSSQEFELVKKEGGFQDSFIFPFQLDYSQYRPRGHYTRNEELERYFRTMMWYGQAPFPLYKLEDNKTVRNVEQTLQAILITYSLFLENEGTQDYVRWENIYDPTVFYVGNSDDLNVLDYKELILKVYGEEPDINTINSTEKLDLFYQEAEKLPEPQIQGKYTMVTTPVGKQYRFMGQRYIPDSEIIQELVEPIIRPIPSGLDVMAVLGSARAHDILLNDYKVPESWPEYTQAFARMADKFTKLSGETWRSNMYYGWLWVLKDLLEPVSQGYPAFMTNEAWQDKSLSTALGSWSELRHDTILYGKQSGAECGGGEEPPQVKGYVEPSISVYERLLWLTKYSRENLKGRDILDGEMESKMQSFEDLLQFLINCSQKELINEELTSDEYNQLLTYGGLLEYLTSSLAGDGLRWFEITSKTDKNMAVIADVHTIAPNQFSNGGYFEVGVGPAYEIYVVVPIDGKLYLTRGAVFSYYEFDSTLRLTDEEWQQMIKENKQPSQPEWMKSYINGGKAEIPDPVNPYSSGC